MAFYMSGYSTANKHCLERLGGVKKPTIVEVFVDLGSKQGT
jgi:hypothetical protein